MSRITLDANVLVYAIDNSDIVKHDRALDVLARATLADTVLTVQVVGETLAVISRKHPALLEDAQRLVERFAEILTIVSTTPAHLVTACAVRQRYRLQFWDSVIIAVARSVDTTVLLTEDMQDGATIDGLTLIDPFDPANRDRIDALLAA